MGDGVYYSSPARGRGGCLGSFFNCVRGAAFIDDFSDAEYGGGVGGAGGAGGAGFAYVGDGRGAYLRLPTSMHHVGQGQGRFDLEEVPLYTGRRPRCCCIALGLLVPIVLLAYAFRHQSTEEELPAMMVEDGALSTTPQTVQIAAAAGLAMPPPRYRCAVNVGGAIGAVGGGGGDAASRWPDIDADGDGVVGRHELWRAESLGVFGQQELAMMRTADLDGDGVLDRKEFDFAISQAGEVTVSLWPAEQREWCCRHESVGCAVRDTPFDCDEAGFAAAAYGWSEEKKEWCCWHMSIACPDASDGSLGDCTEDSPASRYPRTHYERQWCCEHWGRHCDEPEQRAALPFDCSVGSSAWREEWSAEKQRFCCSQGQGCPDSSTTTTATTTTVTTRTMTLTPGQAHATITTIAASAASPSARTKVDGAAGEKVNAASEEVGAYDCGVGELRWWNSAKRAWCCEREGAGCQGTTETANRAPPSPERKKEDVPAPSRGEGAHQAEEEKEKEDGEVHSDIRGAALPAAAAAEVMTCDLRCAPGRGARAVPLAALGDGGNVTAEECRALCLEDSDCEGISLGDGECFRGRDFHLHECSESSELRTEVLRSRPWSACEVAADGQVVSFDRRPVAEVGAFPPGVFSLIDSEVLRAEVSLEARDAASNVSVAGLAIGGAHVDGHLLDITLGSDLNVLWDGRNLFVPSNRRGEAYESPDGWLTVTAKASHEVVWLEGRPVTSFRYDFHLGPDVRLLVDSGPAGGAVVIEARRLPVPQDGYCGNFDCDTSNDAQEELERRGKAGPVDERATLFSGGD